MSNRTPIQALETAGGSPGQVPTINAAGTALEYGPGGSTDPEVVRDTIASALVEGSGVSISVNDAGDSITISATAGGGGGSSAALGYAAHDPATLTDYATSSATPVDLDATNLAVTFTAPESGKVLVSLSALGNGASGAALNWHVREGTSTLATRYIKTCNSSDFPGNALLVVSGLVSGSSHTFKWAQSRTGSGTVDTYAGGVVGPAVMAVTALP